MATNDMHVVFGATGGSGSAVVRALLAQGKRVRAVNRSGRAALPPEVEVVRADAADPASARAASAGAAVVYNCVNLPYQQWTARLMPALKGILAGAAAAEARLVFVDNMYMYGPVDGPLHEDLPSRATGPKGRLRAEMAETLLEAHQRGIAQVSIGRAADFYGPNIHTALLTIDSFRAALAGKRVRWPGRLDVPHSLMFIDDFARGLITLGARDEAQGQIWHLPHAAPLTGRQLLELLFEEAGQPPKIGVLSRPIVRLGGLFNPLAREFVEELYQFEQPFIVDSSKFERVFGQRATPMREGIRQTLAWIRQQMPQPLAAAS